MRFDFAGRGRPVLRVESIELPRRLARFEQQRLAVGKRGTQRRAQETVHPHAWQSFQRPHQLKTLAVIAREAEGKDLADAQRRQVVDDGAGAAGLVRTRTTLKTGSPVSNDISGRAGSISR